MEAFPVFFIPSTGGARGESQVLKKKGPCNTARARKEKGVIDG